MVNVIFETNVKCEYCKSKANYVWLKINIFERNLRFLCEEHKLIRDKLK